MTWEGANFEVIGVDAHVIAADSAAAAREHQAAMVGVSARHTTVVGVWEVVGGAPVTADYASSIGADGYAESAAITIEVAKALAAQTEVDPA
jgi:5-methyltetrahydrofolate--homocysteine methyltransferase